MSRKTKIVVLILAAIVFIGLSTALITIKINAAKLQTELQQKDHVVTQLQNTNDSLKKQLTGTDAALKKVEHQVQDLQNQLEQEKKTKQRELALKKQREQQAVLASRGDLQLTSSAAYTSGWMYFRASFYNDSGTTASGKYTSDTTIAVDPNYIPLGAWVEIKFPDGHIEQRRAEDTGGAIRGNKIDVYKPLPTSSLLGLGVQDVQLRVIGH